MRESFLNGRVVMHGGDSREVLKTLADHSIDSIVTDPPYALVSIVKRFGADGAAPVNVPEGGSGAYARASSGFMGKQWDTGETAFAVEFWQECLRVLKPGGHVVAFSGTRTYHRMACAIEDAGFEIRDQLQWVYGSGFPKSHDVSKGIDRAAGAEREKVKDFNPRNPKATGFGRDGMEGATRPWIEAALTLGYHEKAGNVAVTEDAIKWQGWGTALKPACEPICFARKPLIGTVAANVLAHGTGAINIDGCRIDAEANRAWRQPSGNGVALSGSVDGSLRNEIEDRSNLGRWPANIIHDGSDEVIAAFPDVHGAGSARSGKFGGEYDATSYDMSGAREMGRFGDEGSAARFFYSAKADSMDRLGSKHPTVKPVDLMQWLVRLVTPAGGVCLDPFAGTGTTAEACFREGMRCVLIEREAEYQTDIRRRMALCMSGPDERKRESIKAKIGDLPFEPGSLFA